jgi:hypothetical protein
MPKEITHAANYGVGQENIKTGDKTYEYHLVSLRWNREGWVELGCASVEPTTETVEDGFFLQLDRDGVARLIRSLQAAGRQAFGKDPW